MSERPARAKTDCPAEARVGVIGLVMCRRRVAEAEPHASRDARTWVALVDGNAPQFGEVRTADAAAR